MHICDLVPTVGLPQGSEILLEFLSPEDTIFYILIFSSTQKYYTSRLKIIIFFDLK